MLSPSDLSRLRHAGVDTRINVAQQFLVIDHRMRVVSDLMSLHLRLMPRSGRSSVRIDGPPIAPFFGATDVAKKELSTPSMSELFKDSCATMAHGCKNSKVMRFHVSVPVSHVKLRAQHLNSV